MAIATARFSSITGEGVMRRSSLYNAAICTQSVSSGRCAWACKELIAAWIWYGPGCFIRSARSKVATPSWISSWFQRERSCSSSRISSPCSPTRAVRRESCSSSNARSPNASGTSVNSNSWTSSVASTRVSRMASSQSSRRIRSLPDEAVYPSLKMR